jgi:hypothetical protein
MKAMAQAKVSEESTGWQPRAANAGRIVERRIAAVMATADAEGLTAGGKAKRISGRVQPKLHAAAAQRSGLQGNELLEYALAKVALEDDFAARLFELEGKVSRDIDLEF